jgi:hypothetical protein
LRKAIEPPAEKARPAPVRIMVFTSGVPSGSGGRAFRSPLESTKVFRTMGSKASGGVVMAALRELTRELNSRPMSKVKALRVLGVFKVITPTRLQAVGSEKVTRLISTVQVQIV